MLINVPGTYIWNKSNLIEMIAQLWIMECNHLGEHSQVLWNDDKIKTVVIVTQHLKQIR